MRKYNFLKSFLILLILALIFYSVIGKLAGFQDIKLVFQKISPVFLFLALIAWLLTYNACGLKLKFILETQGYKIKFLELLKFGALGAFAIHFLPVGNFGESALIFYLLGEKGIKSTSSLALFLIRLIFDYLAFFLLFSIALISLPVHPSLNFLTKLLFGIILIALISGIIYLQYTLQRPQKFIKIAKPILKNLKKTLNFLKNNYEEESESYIENLTQELYQEILKVVKIKRALVWLFIACLLYWSLDALVLYFSLVGLGLALGFNAVFFSYAISMLLGIASFLPAGIGALEGSLILLLRSFSLDTTLAAFSVLNYRFISLWLAISVGLVAFYSLLKNNKGFPQVFLKDSAKIENK